MLESDRLGEVLVLAGMGSRLPFDGPLVAAACLRARGGSDGCARGRGKGLTGRRLVADLSIPPADEQPGCVCVAALRSKLVGQRWSKFVTGPNRP